MTTTRRRVLQVLGAGAAGTALSVPAAAKECRLDWRKHINEYKPHGRPVVNATQKVENSKDSGHQGNYWAYIDHRRSLQAWQVGTDQYRLLAQYTGQFDGVEGQQSPGTSEGPTLSGDESGTFQGGYAATIDGTMLAEPAWDTHGFVGTFDYEASIPGPSPPPGYVDWVAQYFEYSEFTYEWWGWIYHGGRCGTWANASTEDCGDVYCEG